MLTADEQKILAMLRQNSRASLADMSRHSGIPTTTLFTKIRKLEGQMIKKHVTLLDFQKLNFGIRVNFIIKLADKHNSGFPEWVQQQKDVNSFFKINNGYDYLIDAIFSNMADMALFSDSLEEHGLLECHVHHITEEVKHEGFMADPAFKLLNSDK